MKSKRLAKLLAVIASVLLAVTVTVCITAFAGESDPATIKRVNISYDGAVRIVYDVALNDADAKPVLLVWDGVEGEKTAANATYVVEDYGVYQYAEDYAGSKFDGVYFMSRGFAPKDMRKPISAAVAVSDGNGGYIYNEKEVATLSIFDYVMKRFEKATATPDQKALYTSLLNYGGAVQAVIYEGSIKNGDSVEVATAKAGLKYGYVDAYVGIRYYEAAMVKGVETTSDATVEYYRAGANVKIEAPTTYMGRFFAGYYDADGNAIADATPSRYLNVERTEPGVIDVVATYERVTGVFANYVSDASGMIFDLNDSTSTTLTKLADGGVSFKKATKTKNPSVSIKPSTSYNTTAGKNYIVADMDISFIDIPDDCMTGAFSMIIVNAGDLSYRLNVARTDKNVITFQTSMENRYIPVITVKGFDDENGGVANGSDLIVARASWKDGSTTKYGGTYYSNYSSMAHNDGFASFKIDAADLKNIRIEIHPENAKLIDYKYRVIVDADGVASTTGDQTVSDRTAKVLAPEVRLYVNGEYAGSTYHGGPGTGNWSANATLDSDFEYEIYSDAAKDVFSTPANKILENKTVPTLDYFRISFMGNGIADIRLANMHYALYNVDNPYYNTYVDTDSKYVYDYTKTSNIATTQGTVGKTKETTVYKGTDGKFSVANSTGATVYKITWQYVGWGVQDKDADGNVNGYCLVKENALVSVKDASGKDLLADGASFEGLKKGDIIQRDWLGIVDNASTTDQEDRTMWGDVATVTNYPAATVIDASFKGDVFVYETDFLLTTEERNKNNYIESSINDATSVVYGYLFHIHKDGIISISECYGDSTTRDKVVIGNVGEVIKLRIEFVVNDYNDMSKNSVNLYVNNALLIAGDNFNQSKISPFGIANFELSFPSTPRDVTMTLTNTYCARYVENGFSLGYVAIPDTGSEKEYDFVAGETIAADHKDITTSSNIIKDATADTVASDKSYLYIDTVDGDEVLRFGKVNKTGENKVYFKIPENDIAFTNIVFSTKMYIAPGLSANTDDFIRFVLLEKENGSKGNGAVDQYAIYPTKATTGETVDYKYNNAIIEQGEWVEFTICYDCTKNVSNVYIDGVLVAQNKAHQSGFVGEDVNYFSIELRGSAGNLKNIDLMFKDIKIGYTKEEPTAQKVVDYTNAADLYSVHYNNITSTKFTNAGGKHLVGTLDGKDNAYTMSWKYEKESFDDLSKEEFNNKLEASTLLFFTNNGSETTGTPTNTPYSVASDTTKYVFETDIRYSRWVFNDLTQGTAGVKTADGSKYYDSWITYFNICDVRDGGDKNAFGTINVNYNSQTDTLTLDKTEIEFDQWYHIRVEFTYNSTTKKFSWVFYLDDVLFKSGTVNETNSAYVDQAVLGFRIKNKSMAYFSEGGMSLANTSFTEYKIDN